MTPKPSFLDLPGEIRNKIYGYLLVTDQPINLLRFIHEYSSIRIPSLHPAVLRTNRQVNAEPTGMLYGANTFVAKEHDSSKYRKRVWGKQRAYQIRLLHLSLGIRVDSAGFSTQVPWEHIRERLHPGFFRVRTVSIVLNVVKPRFGRVLVQVKDTMCRYDFEYLEKLLPPGQRHGKDRGFDPYPLYRAGANPFLSVHNLCHILLPQLDDLRSLTFHIPKRIPKSLGRDESVNDPAFPALDLCAASTMGASTPPAKRFMARFARFVAAMNVTPTLTGKGVNETMRTEFGKDLRLFLRTIVDE